MLFYYIWNALMIKEISIISQNYQKILINFMFDYQSSKKKRIERISKFNLKVMTCFFLIKNIENLNIR